MNVTSCILLHKSVQAKTTITHVTFDKESTKYVRVSVVLLSENIKVCPANMAQPHDENFKALQFNISHVSRFCGQNPEMTECNDQMTKIRQKLHFQSKMASFLSELQHRVYSLFVNPDTLHNLSKFHTCRWNHVERPPKPALKVALSSYFFTPMLGTNKISHFSPGLMELQYFICFQACLGLEKGD